MQSFSLEDPESWTSAKCMESVLYFGVDFSVDKGDLLRI